MNVQKLSVQQRQLSKNFEGWIEGNEIHVVSKLNIKHMEADAYGYLDRIVCTDKSVHHIDDVLIGYGRSAEEALEDYMEYN